MLFIFKHLVDPNMVAFKLLTTKTASQKFLAKVFKLKKTLHIFFQIIFIADYLIGSIIFFF